jgi:hypothetical protein
MFRRFKDIILTSGTRVIYDELMFTVSLKYKPNMALAHAHKGTHVYTPHIVMRKLVKILFEGTIR